MNRTIIDADERHHDAILALNEAAVPAVNSIPLAALRSLAAQSCYFRVAVTGDAVAGFLLVLPPGAAYESLNYRWFSAHYDEFVYIDRVVVAPAHAGQGVGRALYEDLVARHPAAPVTCEVNVKPRNGGSLAFHAAMGFDEVGQQDTEGGTKRVSLLLRPPVGGVEPRTERPAETTMTQGGDQDGV